MLKTEELQLVSEWDKTFPQSEKVDHKKVTFVNRYGITLAADLYKPKNVSGKCPAIAVSGPFGAVKEQCSRSHYNALGHCSGKLVRVIWKMLTDNVEFNLK